MRSLLIREDDDGRMHAIPTNCDGSPVALHGLIEFARIWAHMVTADLVAAGLSKETEAPSDDSSQGA